MKKFIVYDVDGNEVGFDYGVDAREAVLTGRYFDKKPGSEKSDSERVDTALSLEKKKGRPAKTDQKTEAPEDNGADEEGLNGADEIEE